MRNKPSYRWAFLFPAVLLIGAGGQAAVGDGVASPSHALQCAAAAAGEPLTRTRGLPCTGQVVDVVGSTIESGTVAGPTFRRSRT